jgi:hypothetical protein
MFGLSFSPALKQSFAEIWREAIDLCWTLKVDDLFSPSPLFPDIASLCTDPDGFEIAARRWQEAPWILGDLLAEPEARRLAREEGLKPRDFFLRTWTRFVRDVVRDYVCAGVIAVRFHEHPDMMKIVLATCGDGGSLDQLGQKLDKSTRNLKIDGSPDDEKSDDKKSAIRLHLWEFLRKLDRSDLFRKAVLGRLYHFWRAVKDRLIDEKRKAETDRKYMPVNYDEAEVEQHEAEELRARFARYLRKQQRSRVLSDKDRQENNLAQSMDLEIFSSSLDKVDQEILKRRLAGYTEEEIASDLQKSQPAVNKRSQKIKKMASEVIK